MSEREPEADEAERIGSKWSAGWEGWTYLGLLLAPGSIGAALVIDGLTSAGYLEAVIGVVLLAATPIVARWVSRAVDI